MKAEKLPQICSQSDAKKNKLCFHGTRDNKTSALQKKSNHKQRLSDERLPNPDVTLFAAKRSSKLNSGSRPTRTERISLQIEEHNEEPLSHQNSFSVRSVSSAGSYRTGSFRGSNIKRKSTLTAMQIGTILKLFWEELQANNMQGITRVVKSHRHQIDFSSAQNSAYADGTAMHVCAQHGWLNLAKLLISLKFSPDMQNKLGLTPLHVAFRQNHIPMIKLLMDQNVPVLIPDKAGQVPFDYSTFNTLDECIISPLRHEVTAQYSEVSRLEALVQEAVDEYSIQRLNQERTEMSFEDIESVLNEEQIKLDKTAVIRQQVKFYLEVNLDELRQEEIRFSNFENEIQIMENSIEQLLQDKLPFAESQFSIATMEYDEIKSQVDQKINELRGLEDIYNSMIGYCDIVHCFAQHDIIQRWVIDMALVLLRNRDILKVSEEGARFSVNKILLRVEMLEWIEISLFRHKNDTIMVSSYLELLAEMIQCYQSNENADSIVSLKSNDFRPYKLPGNDIEINAVELNSCNMIDCHNWSPPLNIADTSQLPQIVWELLTKFHNHPKICSFGCKILFYIIPALETKLAKTFLKFIDRNASIPLIILHDACASTDFKINILGPDTIYYVAAILYKISCTKANRMLFSYDAISILIKVILKLVELTDTDVRVLINLMGVLAQLTSVNSPPFSEQNLCSQICQVFEQCVCLWYDSKKHTPEIEGSTFLIFSSSRLIFAGLHVLHNALANPLAVPDMRKLLHSSDKIPWIMEIIDQFMLWSSQIPLDNENMNVQVKLIQVIQVSLQIIQQVYVASYNSDGILMATDFKYIKLILRVIEWATQAPTINGLTDYLQYNLTEKKQSQVAVALLDLLYNCFRVIANVVGCSDSSKFIRKYFNELSFTAEKAVEGIFMSRQVIAPHIPLLMALVEISVVLIDNYCWCQVINSSKDTDGCIIASNLISDSTVQNQVRSGALFKLTTWQRIQTIVDGEAVNDEKQDPKLLSTLYAIKNLINAMQIKLKCSCFEGQGQMG